MTGFRGKRFMVSITRVDPTTLEWPSAEERRSETLGGNRDYARLGHVKWSDVREFVNVERHTVEEIAQASDWETHYEDWLEERYEDPFLFGFDLEQMRYLRRWRLLVVFRFTAVTVALSMTDTMTPIRWWRFTVELQFIPLYCPRRTRHQPVWSITIRADLTHSAVTSIV
jgi:hypothetical protein